MGCSRLHGRYRVSLPFHHWSVLGKSRSFSLYSIHEWNCDHAALKVCICQYSGIDAMAGLPLAAGLLIATTRLDASLASIDFSIKVDRIALDQAVQNINKPDVLGISLYPWNTAYTVAVAEAVKRSHPSGLIVAGGPAVPRRPQSATAFLDAHPYIDVLVFGEGELAFRELLRTLSTGDSLDNVPSIAWRSDDGNYHFTSPPERVLDFRETGSPYLDGTFDALLESHPKHFSMALIETNRGCPFSCTFCDWSLTKKVVELPFDRVAAEIDWATEHSMSTVCFTDANFGMRKRDRSIAEHLAERKRVTGAPHTCYFYLTKNSHQRNLQTIDIFTKAGISYCVGLAVQDFDDDVLVAVKRDNIQSSHSEELGDICARRGIRTHNELILGLPGQTYDSFVETVLRSMTPYALHEFRIYMCRLIDNAELADPQSRELHAIQSRNCLWRPSEPEFDPVVQEYQELVVGTSTMSINDWRRICRFAYFAAAVYNQRLLRVVLRYFHQHGIDRRGWLEHLCEAMKADGEHSVYGAIGQAIDRLVDSILEDGPLSLPLDGLGPALHEMAEAITITAFTDIPGFFRQTRELTLQFLNGAVPEAIIDEMIDFQQFGTPIWNQTETRHASFEHDWLAYAADSFNEPLKQHQTNIQYQPPTYVQVPTFGGFATIHLACMLAGVDTGELSYALDQNEALRLVASLR